MKPASVKDPLQLALAYEFRDPTLLLTALTHKSLEHHEYSIHGRNNERLEFLGDAVLSLVSADYLYRLHGHINEGELSRLRSQYVCQENLSQAAKKLGLGDFILSDKAMRSSGSTNAKSVLADALEAIIGAIFLDGGLKAAEEVILHVLGRPDTTVVAMPMDAKTKLQELVQALYQDAPRYSVLQKTGPAHAPTFEVGVLVRGEIVARACGENKKTAAQNAAAIALLAFASEEKKAP